MTTEREQFEAWAADQWYPLQKHVTGCYLDPRTECAWEAWQAARASAVPQWVPFTERQPEPREIVLAWCGDAECAGIAWMVTDENGHALWFMPEPQSIGYAPSHWMPLPVAPSKEGR